MNEEERIENPYRAVIGTLPRKREVALWSYDRFMDFFNFVTFFMQDNVVKVTDERRKEMEKNLGIPHHPFQEFLYRINVFRDNKQATSRQFYYRLAAMMRTVGAYLKENPALVSEDMKKIIEPNPRLNWIIKQFKIVETKAGGEVVEADNQDTVGFQRGPAANAELNYLTTLAKAVNVFDLLVSSIKANEIKSMDVKDRINAASKLSFIFSNMRNMKPNARVFQQINILKAETKDLEKSILDFSEETNGQN